MTAGSAPPRLPVSVTALGILAPRLRLFRLAMGAICANLRASLPDVLEELKETISDLSIDVPTDRHLAALPEVVVGMVEASVSDPQDVALHRACIEVAANHGEWRRRQNCPEDVLHREYAVVRETLNRHVARQELPQKRITEALIRIDMAATVATLASIRGFHRLELEQTGRWEGSLDRIARASPLLDFPAME